MIGLLGDIGAGKTLEAQRLANALARSGYNIRIYDSWQSFDGRVYTSVGSYHSSVSSTKRIPVVAVFRPNYPGSPEAVQLFDDVLSLVAGEGGVLIIDELPEAVDPRKPLNPNLARIALRGRKDPRCVLIWASQRAALVHPHLRAGTQVLYVFRQKTELDIKWLKHNTQPYGDYVSKTAPTLANLQFIKVPLSGGPTQTLSVSTIVPESGETARRGRG